MSGEWVSEVEQSGLGWDNCKDNWAANTKKWYLSDETTISLRKGTLTKGSPHPPASFPSLFPWALSSNASFPLSLSLPLYSMSRWAQTNKNSFTIEGKIAQPMETTNITQILFPKEELLVSMQDQTMFRERMYKSKATPNYRCPPSSLFLGTVKLSIHIIIIMYRVLIVCSYPIQLESKVGYYYITTGNCLGSELRFCNGYSQCY